MVEEQVVEEPVLEEPVASVPVVAAAVVAPEQAGERKRSWSVVAVGGTVVVLLLMTALATLVVREIKRGGGDTGSLAGQVSYAAPVAVPAGDAYVRSTVLPGGRLRVEHWIRTRHLRNELRIQLPDVTGLPPGALTAGHLVLAADGLRVYAPASVPRRGLMLAVPPAHRLFVSYVLSGAVQASDHPAGRALARVVAIDVDTGEPTTRSVTTVVGAHVLALACSAPTRGALPQPCGAVRDGAWQVELATPHAHDRVMAQLDLG